MVAVDAAVRADLVRLEEIRAARSQTSRKNARKAIARETQIAPGTLENIKNMRTKGVRMWVAQKLRDVLLRELQREMARLQHEYQILVASGSSHRDSEMEQVVADLARARKALEAVK
jgi:arginyl-tRNA synthetase